MLPAGDTQGIQLLVPHGHPGPAQAHLPIHPLRRADVHIPDVGADIGVQLGDGDVEVVQHKFRLPVEQPRPAGLIGVLRVQNALQPAVGDGGADGVGVRVSVSDHLDGSGVLFLSRHTVPSCLSTPIIANRTPFFKCSLGNSSQMRAGQVLYTPWANRRRASRSPDWMASMPLATRSGGQSHHLSSSSCWMVFSGKRVRMSFAGTPPTMV